MSHQSLAAAGFLMKQIPVKLPRYNHSQDIAVSPYPVFKLPRVHVINSVFPVSKNTI
jgi:hypothetical protein